MKTIKQYWSDGTSFDLSEGQIWIPNDKNDYTLKIKRILDHREFPVVEFEQIETGEIYEHELDGPDSFADYLESLFYVLKK